MISNPTAGWEQSGKETWKGCLHCKSPAGLVCYSLVSVLSLAAVTSAAVAAFPRPWPGWIIWCCLFRARDRGRTPHGATAAAGSAAVGSGSAAVGSGSAAARSAQAALAALRGRGRRRSARAGGPGHRSLTSASPQRLWAERDDEPRTGAPRWAGSGKGAGAEPCPSKQERDEHPWGTVPPLVCTGGGSCHSQRREQCKKKHNFPKGWSHIIEKQTQIMESLNGLGCKGLLKITWSGPQCRVTYRGYTGNIPNPF